jgi:predicted nucleotidyltransferase
MLGFHPSLRHAPSARHGKLALLETPLPRGYLTKKLLAPSFLSMRPSAVLDFKRSVIRETAGRYRVANPRVFGSVLHGTDRDGSDLDLLVDALPGTTLFDLGELQVELESLLGMPVDILTPGDIPASFRVQVLAEAQPV